MRDVTERKEQEQALEEARAEAERANAAKSRFLATMSHELRTPLNAIIGFSEMLTKEELLMIDAARRHEYAHLINESGHHLLSVVNGILDMSKIETGNFEITPEPFAPRAGDGRLLRSADSEGARSRHRARDCKIADRPAGDRGRQALAQSDHAQSGCRTRSSSPTAAARSRSAPASRTPASRSRSRITASASAPTICRASATRSSRRARPTTGATTAPGSACRS